MMQMESASRTDSIIIKPQFDITLKQKVIPIETVVTLKRKKSDFSSWQFI